MPPPLRDSLSEEEKNAIARALPPFGITPFYASLAGSDPSDPIRRQCIPSPLEALTSAGETEDPLGARHHLVGGRLIHQYKNRLLVLSVGHCAGYCRHCFRRDWEEFQAPWLSPAQLDELEDYIGEHPELDEVLISGGDPLVASNRALKDLFKRIRRAEGPGPKLIIRIGSRLPLTWPQRINKGLVRILATARPLRIMLHVNHKRELAPEVLKAIARLIDAGIPIHSQTVLLKGVNDTLTDLSQLFRSLVVHGISPYYLFQGDLARGTAHLRVDLKEGAKLYREVKKAISPLACPQYTLDLPGGLGKMPVPEADALILDEEAPFPAYKLMSAEGKICHYPLG